MMIQGVLLKNEMRARASGRREIAFDGSLPELPGISRFFMTGTERERSNLNFSAYATK